MLSPEELARYAQVMRENGVVQLKCDGLELVVTPKPPSFPAERQEPVELSRQYTPEEWQELQKLASAKGMSVEDYLVATGDN